jgi:hypothetical protein
MKMNKDNVTNLFRDNRMKIMMKINMWAALFFICIGIHAQAEESSGEKIQPIAQTVSNDLWKKGKWWWQPVNSDARWQHVLFRKRLTLTSSPVVVPLAISADCVYRLHVNGKLVMHGPARSEHGTVTFDSLDIGRWLHQGENILAVEVGYAQTWDAGQHG